MVKTIETALKKATNPKYGPSWTEAEEEVLRRMKEQGATAKNIAAALGRSESAIGSKWANLRKSARQAENQ